MSSLDAAMTRVKQGLTRVIGAAEMTRDNERNKTQSSGAKSKGRKAESR